ncbi:nuclease-related domain-containing protein [Rummeliibacillus sp. JY-2-4R]
MIKKPYSSTHYLDALGNLAKRLTLSNHKREMVENEYNRIKAGDIGEKFVMQALEQLHLQYDFYVFHNLSLFIETKIQIDILIVTKYYLIIFEVKNIKGAIEFRQNPSQLIRTLPNDEINSFNSPETQLEEYIYQLKTFVLNQGINIPIYGAIVFPFSTSFIKTTSSKTTILLKSEIKPFLRKIPIKKEYLSAREVEQLTAYLLTKNNDYNIYPLLTRYNIAREQILNGVICTNCGELGMKRSGHFWFCPKCKIKSKTAHEPAIYDYLKIVNNTITNAECREFLNLRDIYQSSRILRNMNLEKLGNYRGAKYRIPRKR